MALKAASPTKSVPSAAAVSPLAKPLRMPKISPTRTIKTIALSAHTRQQWLREAQGLLDNSQLDSQLQQALEHTPARERGISTTFIDEPTLTSPIDEVIDAMSMAVSSNPRLISKTTAKLAAPGCIGTALPKYLRDRNPDSPKMKQNRCQRRRKHVEGQSVSPLLLSQEMIVKLQHHLEDKLRGNIWQNEIRSRLARPLSATTFCNRGEQLNHPLAARKFLDVGTRHDSQDQYPMYPYSQEAHDLTRAIGRAYGKHCFRMDLLASARRLAVAIRRFRRVVIPWLVKAHRRRRRAALKVQRALRCHFRWKRDVLRPFATVFTSSMLKRVIRKLNAEHIFATKLLVLCLSRRARKAHERERRRVLFRWVAKTRVSLFVHRVWCVTWFRLKRQRNVTGLLAEVAQLEHSDVEVRKEYSTIFLTSFGKKLLKRELTEWRAHVRVQQSSSGATSSSTVVENQMPSDTSDDAVFRLRQCFRVFDLDGSGTLDLDEFQLMLSHLRRSLHGGKNSKHKYSDKLTTAQTRDLFESLDSDGNGKVTCEEFETWWSDQRGKGGLGSSASLSLLSSGLDRLVLTSQGLLFWLLGKRQQLERKFVKKLLVKRAMDSAKRALMEKFRQEQPAETRRCDRCGRRFGLQRDRLDHQLTCAASEWVVDTFTQRRWIREEELRLLDENHAEIDVQQTSQTSDS